MTGPIDGERDSMGESIKGEIGGWSEFDVGGCGESVRLFLLLPLLFEVPELL